MGRFSSFLLGVLLGSLVGSAAALLMAPESGQDVRQQLTQFKDDLQRQVSEAKMKRRLEMELELARLRSSEPGGNVTIE